MFLQCLKHFAVIIVSLDIKIQCPIPQTVFGIGDIF